MLGVKLVENWKEGWRWVSSQCMALSLALIGSWEALPPSWKEMLPSEDLKLYVGPLLILGFVGRFIDQSKKAPE